MSDVKLCDCCGLRILEDTTRHKAMMVTDNERTTELDICGTCMAVIVELPLAPIRKVRRQRKAKA